MACKLGIRNGHLEPNVHIKSLSLRLLNPACFKSLGSCYLALDKCVWEVAIQLRSLDHTYLCTLIATSFAFTQLS